MSSKFLVFLFAAFGLLPIVTLAQIDSASTSTASPNQEISQNIANINISNAAIISQDLKAAKIGFDIENASLNPQPEIKYGIQLIQTTNKYQNIVDSFVADESVDIAGKMSAHRELVYNFPTFLSGTYELWITAKTSGGLMLGLANPGKITLAGSNEYVSLTSCKLNVEGKDYTINEGVDIVKNEKLMLICNAENLAEKNLTVTPFFNTFLRSTYGPVVNVDYPAQDLINFAPKEKKEISFIIFVI